MVYNRTRTTAQVISPAICAQVFLPGFTGAASILAETTFLFAAMIAEAMDIPMIQRHTKQK